MELEGKTVLITPEMAEEFLKHNTRNRNIRLPYVEELATYMRQGKWDVTHQGIGFYEDGTLFDGQHRLHAIIKAGVPVKMMVTYGIALAATHADTGLKRSEADLVKLMGNSEFQWVGAREIAITNILKVQFPRLGLVTLEDKAAFMQFYKTPIALLNKPTIRTGQDCGARLSMRPLFVPTSKRGQKRNSLPQGHFLHPG